MKIALNQASQIGLAIFIAGSIFVLFSWGIKWYYPMVHYNEAITSGLVEKRVNNLGGPRIGTRAYKTFLFEPLLASKKDAGSIFYITIAFALLLLTFAYFARSAFLRSVLLGAALFLIPKIIMDIVFLWDPGLLDLLDKIIFLGLSGFIILIVSIFYMLLHVYKNPRWDFYKQTILTMLIIFLICILAEAFSAWGSLLSLNAALIAIIILSAYFFMPALFVGCVYASTYLIFNYSYWFYGSMYSGTIIVMGALVSGLSIILVYNLFRNILENRRAIKS